MIDRACISPRRGRLRAAVALLTVVASLGVWGCGTAVTIPRIPKMKLPSARGGSAAFDIDGNTFSVSQSGHVSASFPDAPQLTYSGPLGCEGHYFTAHYTEHIEVFFRYSSRDAYLLIDNGADPVFHFTGAPRQVGQSKFWRRSFGGRPISVRVTCPKH
jgi:hypothetical protein